MALMRDKTTYDFMCRDIVKNLDKIVQEVIKPFCYKGYGLMSLSTFS